MIHSSETARLRLDKLLVVRGLAETREKAQALILEGRVLVEGRPGGKAGALVPAEARIEITGGLRYVSRGGWKLEGALDDFGIDPGGKIAMDVGSSTGGFTDCLLQRGARRVYAIDVSTDQLDWKLRQNERVTIIRRNARYLCPEDLPEPADLVTADLSFISVTKVLPALVPCARPGAEFLILVKPQFELERGEVGRGGIVREEALRERSVKRVRTAAVSLGLVVLGVKPSRIPGAEGNQEFFLHARTPGHPCHS